jgi:hypothetical protein
MMTITSNLTPQIKVELVHKPTLLGFLHQLCEHEKDIGFTTIEVQAGSGVLDGVYSPDVTDAQYYSFILLPEERLGWFLKVLKKNLGAEKCFVFSSAVNKVTL